ncbi:hypothetical protein [Aeromonas hydrophila]|uniref:hypothetical protein n=1 Tax=Aeromonas hydrophila TaxID=644 RepID=UPI00188DFA87|nr:hypothetical protein [Aeromonas hydrophila]MBF4801485.1 hypothetical protein [Aeromonas hydrophila]
MSRVFCSLFLFFFTLFSYAKGDVSYPTEIPDSEHVQRTLMQQLLAIPESQRSQQQWRQLSLVSIALLSNADSSLVKEAEVILNQARAIYPQDAEIMAVQGSLFCIQAGSHSIDSMQAMTLANKGFRQLDRAVLVAPEQLGPRLQRAITASRAPTFLGKRPLARDDFAYLLSVVPAIPDTQMLRAMLLYHLGELSQQDKDLASSMWKQAAVLEGGVWSERARVRMSP